jgi:hypothetical protein
MLEAGDEIWSTYLSTHGDGRFREMRLMLPGKETGKVHSINSCFVAEDSQSGQRKRLYMIGSRAQA